MEFETDFARDSGGPGLDKFYVLREVTSRGAVIMAGTAIEEALARDSDDARMIRSLLDDKSIGRVAAPAGADALMGDFRIDRGETETIAVARETGATCATDDGPAIRCCRALGIPFTSAIGLLAAMAEVDVVEPTLALDSSPICNGSAGMTPESSRTWPAGSALPRTRMGEARREGCDEQRPRGFAAAAVRPAQHVVH